MEDKCKAPCYANDPMLDEAHVGSEVESEVSEVVRS